MKKFILALTAAIFTSLNFVLAHGEVEDTHVESNMMDGFFGGMFGMGFFGWIFMILVIIALILLIIWLIRQIQGPEKNKRRYKR